MYIYMMLWAIFLSLEPRFIIGGINISMVFAFISLVMFICLEFKKRKQKRLSSKE